MTKQLTIEIDASNGASDHSNMFSEYRCAYAPSCSASHKVSRRSPAAHALVVDQHDRVLTIVLNGRVDHKVHFVLHRHPDRCGRQGIPPSPACPSAGPCAHSAGGGRQRTDTAREQHRLAEHVTAVRRAVGGANPEDQQLGQVASHHKPQTIHSGTSRQLVPGEDQHLPYSLSYSCPYCLSVALK